MVLVACPIEKDMQSMVLAREDGQIISLSQLLVGASCDMPGVLLDAHSMIAVECTDNSALVFVGDHLRFLTNST